MHIVWYQCMHVEHRIISDWCTPLWGHFCLQYLVHTGAWTVSFGVAEFFEHPSLGEVILILSGFTGFVLGFCVFVLGSFDIRFSFCFLWVCLLSLEVWSPSGTVWVQLPGLEHVGAICKPGGRTAREAWFTGIITKALPGCSLGVGALWRLSGSDGSVFGGFTSVLSHHGFRVRSSVIARGQWWSCSGAGRQAQCHRYDFGGWWGFLFCAATICW